MKKLNKNSLMMKTFLQCRRPIVFLACMTVFMNAPAQIPFSGTRSIGPGGYYSTLTAAVSDAATNGINGALILELVPTYTSGADTYLKIAVAADVAPVPEADTWAMMLAGLGLMGFIARRRTQA